MILLEYKDINDLIWHIECKNQAQFWWGIVKLPYQTQYVELTIGPLKDLIRIFMKVKQMLYQYFDIDQKPISYKLHICISLLLYFKDFLNLLSHPFLSKTDRCSNCRDTIDREKNKKSGNYLH